jgi:hypothetical protein
LGKTKLTVGHGTVVANERKICNAMIYCFLGKTESWWEDHIAGDNPLETHHPTALLV